jgi:ApbE superfamily uncharacterized protein (UPF0280 family)
MLRITAPEEFSEECRAAALSAWEQLNAYALRQPAFRSSKTPIEVPDDAPAIVREMVAASTAAGVGPAYTTHGAVTDHVGRYLARVLPEVMVTAAGDYYIRSRKRLKLGLHPSGGAANGLSLVVDPRRGTQGVFTSSTEIRLPAQSVDMMAVLASSCVLADAAAAAVMAILSRPRSFRSALAYVRRMEGVQGAVVVQGRRIGIAGAVELAA